MFEKPAEANSEDRFAPRRRRMVTDQLVRRGIRDEAVLNAMRTVPRHRFIPERYRREAYKDGPVPIGANQTISQPYIVASMTEHLQLTPTSRVLEVGTGCGYQTAVLAEIAREVYSVERIPELHENARRLLDSLGYRDVNLRLGDGSHGWPEAAPFDAIIVTAAAPDIPDALVTQLVEGGRMVLPLEDVTGRQELIRLTYRGERIEREDLYEVRFVPMLGGIERGR